MASKTEHKRKVVEILLLAFEQNKSVNYICCDDALRYTRIRLLMEYAYKVCNRYGKIFLSEDENACALVLFPDKRNSTFKSLFWDIKLAFQVIGLDNISKILKREKEIKKYHPVMPFYYLWFIGVHPYRQGMGKGSSMLQTVLADAKQMGRPVYLETSTLENLPWYKRFGFTIYAEMDFGYRFFLLKNNTPANE
ncbi:GNAT family N-acetyltransferase [Pedobacter nutrimenti]|uniref:Acetyltransferase (GNAT) family protein n=1 Tax=Pedobacter nutrimenti TaxID=1241337 RepID=A0A318UGF7_9SPHI|nr:GNAT family N-acetyltransferase [Pedobacter nutrimenti]PYF74570.1 acetyltransferase (GNAT) family protein [Pedobacter nutrimenti]